MRRSMLLQETTNDTPAQRAKIADLYTSCHVIARAALSKQAAANALGRAQQLLQLRIQGFAQNMR